MVFIVFIQPDFSLLEAMGDREALIQQRAKEADQLSTRYLEQFQTSPVSSFDLIMPANFLLVAISHMSVSIVLCRPKMYDLMCTLVMQGN